MNSPALDVVLFASVLVIVVLTVAIVLAGCLLLAVNARLWLSRRRFRRAVAVVTSSHPGVTRAERRRAHRDAWRYGTRPPARPDPARPDPSVSERRPRMHR